MGGTDELSSPQLKRLGLARWRIGARDPETARRKATTVRGFGRSAGAPAETVWGWVWLLALIAQSLQYMSECVL